MGKGDARRPASVSEEEYEANWYRVFGKKKEPGPDEAVDEVHEGEEDREGTPK